MSLQKAGHSIIDLKPSLVPIELNEKWLKELMGLSLKNISLSILKITKFYIKSKVKCYSQVMEYLVH